MRDGLDPPRRAAEQPPERFEYDPSCVADVYAWLVVCPNLYLNGVPHSRFVYDVGTSLEDGRGEVVAYRKDGGRVEDPPLAEPEDTEELLVAYERLRQKYRNTGGFYQFEQYERRPTTLDVEANGRGNALEIVAGVLSPDHRPNGHVLQERRRRKVAERAERARWARREPGDSGNPVPADQIRPPPRGAVPRGLPRVRATIRRKIPNVP